MADEQNWYRQLLALSLLSISRAAVEFLTNPSSRRDAGNQMRDAFSQIDYDAAAKALTKAIDDTASTGKSRLNEAIDSLRDRSVDAVGDAKTKAEKQLGQKRGGGKFRLLLLLVIFGGMGYYLMDEQRRDDLLDRLTGASGPIDTTSTFGEPTPSYSSSATTDTSPATDTSPTSSTTSTVATEATTVVEPMETPEATTTTTTEQAAADPVSENTQL